MIKFKIDYANRGSNVTSCYGVVFGCIYCEFSIRSPLVGEYISCNIKDRDLPNVMGLL